MLLLFYHSYSHPNLLSHYENQSVIFIISLVIQICYFHYSIMEWLLVQIILTNACVSYLATYVTTITIFCVQIYVAMYRNHQSFNIVERLI